ncbi:EamA family transporter RarD [Roseovarius indicus]|uniref:Putative chloramphenical resistance permease RarD n=1 Tax=Roseovarius indicus TaxID=540747 RepID=A0A0T5P415_9RHOB|nr:EamA family transporter RarD [Roseovarius indicus]KRS15862.1 RarD protein [Roseovarius indicus]QEW26417.1 putative chloramphenical resistance permease RarD [Roseovarius indicus]SFE63359.1 chloramphenicol-sensitive protein RarD [Roseovarius indicus]
MTEGGKGIAAIVAACTIWGLSALYYKLLDHVPPLEVLAHRTIWSFVFFAGVLIAQRRLTVLRQALSNWKDVAIVAFAALMISCNWFVFISSIQTGHAIEASMGYYTFPLASVLMGAIFFRERLGPAQAAAVALAAIAVVVLAAGLGVAPWIPIIVAATFALYGVAKKWLTVGPVVSVTAEVMLLSPIAAVLLWQAHHAGTGHYGTDIPTSLLLMFSGLLTGTPLILFSYAARRLTMATVGLLQYINPSLQFLCATLIFREVFSIWHAIAFGLIWTALAIYTTALWRQDRVARRVPPSV